MKISFKRLRTRLTKCLFVTTLHLVISTVKLGHGVGQKGYRMSARVRLHYI